MKRILVLMMLVSCFATKAEEPKTRLIVGITVSQFYPEWLTIYRSELKEGGLKRLMMQGQKLTADYDYLYSQTGVDQASIYTGMLPSEHGIVAHDWYDRLKNKRQNSVLSDDYAGIGAKSPKSFAPDFLQALSLGCALKMNDSFSKIYSISMNGEEAVLSGGSCADMALWFSEDKGIWMSSQYYADSLPQWLNNHNSKMESDFFIRRGWMPLEEEESNTITLKLKSKVGLNSGFFFDIAQAKRKFNTYRVLKATPYANTMVVDLSEKLIQETALGKDNDVDLLTLNFSMLDYMNRDFGVYSKEFQDAFLRFDRDVEKLLNVLDTKIGRGNYTICLTFSEARELLPEELNKIKLNSGYFSIFKAVALLKSYLNLVYGGGDWVTDYDAGQIYLNRGLIEKNKIDLKEMQDKVADFLIEFEGISKVLPAYSLTQNAFSNGENQLIQNSFSQKRSGDVMFALQPSWLPELKDVEDNYFRYSKRTKVPVYFYGAGVGSAFSTECHMVDVLPTLCRIAGVPVPYMAKGKSVFN